MATIIIILMRINSRHDIGTQQLFGLMRRRLNLPELLPHSRLGDLDPDPLVEEMSPKQREKIDLSPHPTWMQLSSSAFFVVVKC